MIFTWTVEQNVTRGIGKISWKMYNWSKKKDIFSELKVFKIYRPTHTHIWNLFKKEATPIIKINNKNDKIISQNTLIIFKNSTKNVIT